MSLTPKEQLVQTGHQHCSCETYIANICKSKNRKRMNKNLNKRINRTIIPVWKTYLYMKIKTYSMQWEVELCSFIYTCKKTSKDRIFSN